MSGTEPRVGVHTGLGPVSVWSTAKRKVSVHDRNRTHVIKHVASHCTDGPVLPCDDVENLNLSHKCRALIYIYSTMPSPTKCLLKHFWAGLTSSRGSQEGGMCNSQTTEFEMYHYVLQFTQHH
jgi:hypothetical protein